MPSRFSAPARRFLADAIHSVMQLELLLLLHREPDRSWSAQAAARELRAPQAWVESQLVDFAGHGTVAYDDAGEGGGASYRYRADGPDAAVVAELAEAYPRRRHAMIKLIFAPPADDVRSFSDAFRLRQEDDDR